MVRTVRGVLAALGAVILFGLAFQAANWIGFQFLGPRLKPLYAVAAAVRKGMARDEVLSIIAKHGSKTLSQHVFDNGDVTLWTAYTFTDTCSTSLHFEGGVLRSTWTIGENSPTDYCPGAPADVR